MTNDIELEKRMICLCHSNSTTPTNLYPKHFYNSKLSKIYDVLNGGEFPQTEGEMQSKGIDSGLLFECLMLSAFSTTEMAIVSSRLIGLYNKRERIKEAHKAHEEALKLDPDSLTDKSEGFEEFMSEHDEIGKGTYELLETPWYFLTQDSRFTEGKAITIFCADPGMGKSFFTIQLFSYFALTDQKAVCWFAEDDKKFATRRAFAQYMGIGNLCDYEFLRQNWGKAKATFEENKDVISKIMQSFYTSNDTNKDNLIRWCREKAREGYKIVGIDPITYFSNDDKAHVADQKIMEELNDIRVQYGTRFFIVTHPRNSSGSKISQDEIAGGRAVSRFAQNILWMTEADEEGANRKMYTLKTRNGKREYGGKTLFDFSRETARFEEINNFSLKLEE